MSARNALSRSHRSTQLPTSRSPLFRQLATEWQQLHRSPVAAAQMAAWGYEALAGLGRPGDVLDAIDEADGVDEIFAALLELHQQGDPLAGRVLLQAMLPALMNRAWRCRLPREDDGPEGRPQVAVTAFWTVIGRARISHKVCEQLTTMTVHEMTYWSRWGSAARWEDAELHGDTEFAAQVETGDVPLAGDELGPDSDLLQVLLWATETGAISSADAQLLSDTYLGRRVTADHEGAAARAGVSVETSRKRATRARQRLVEALRDDQVTPSRNEDVSAA